MNVPLYESLLEQLRAAAVTGFGFAAAHYLIRRFVGGG